MDKSELCHAGNPIEVSRHSTAKLNKMKTDKYKGPIKLEVEDDDVEHTRQRDHRSDHTLVDSWCLSQFPAHRHNKQESEIGAYIGYQRDQRAPSDFAIFFQHSGVLFLEPAACCPSKLDLFDKPDD